VGYELWFIIVVVVFLGVVVVWPVVKQKLKYRTDRREPPLKPPPTHEDWESDEPVWRPGRPPERY
jgi:hypothetical protein